jgi:predicted aconitase with swiveling domain/ADP-ribose pyrophosphatase YjhB (NUDIX family)
MFAEGHVQGPPEAYGGGAVILQGRAISSGRAEGKVLKYNETFSFLGGVNASTGELKVGEGNIAGKVFVFVAGKGSTVGSFVMYDLMVHGKAPIAVVNNTAETIVTTGAVISSIPMVDRIDIDVLQDGDVVVVNGDNGTVELKGVNVRKVVSSAIINDAGKILLLQRPDTSKSFPGRRSLVAGKVEQDESVEAAAPREIMEETQIKVGKHDASLPPVFVREEDTIWEVYPFLFKVNDPTPVLNKENLNYEWIKPEDIRKDSSIVPQTYDVVNKMLKMLK